MDRILQRRDTAANWSTTNPILAEGEIGIITDGAKGYKIGDGVTRWNALEYPANPTNVVGELGDSEVAVINQNSSFKYNFLSNVNASIYLNNSSNVSIINKNNIHIKKEGFSLIVNDKVFRLKLSEDKTYVPNPDYLHCGLVIDGDFLYSNKTSIASQEASEYIEIVNLDHVSIVNSNKVLLAYWYKLPNVTVISPVGLFGFLSKYYDRNKNIIVSPYVSNVNNILYSGENIKILSKGFYIINEYGEAYNVCAVEGKDDQAIADGYIEFKPNPEITQRLTISINLLENKYAPNNIISFSELELKSSAEVEPTDIVLAGWYYSKLSIIGYLSKFIEKDYNNSIFKRLKVEILPLLNNSNNIWISNNKNTIYFRKAGFSVLLDNKYINIGGLDSSKYQETISFTGEGRHILVLDISRLNITSTVTKVDIETEGLLTVIPYTAFNETRHVELVYWYYGTGIVPNVGLLGYLANNTVGEVVDNVISRNKDKESAILSSGYRTPNETSAGEIKPLTIAHISDIHGDSSKQQFKNLINVINTYSNIDFGIITGDLVEAYFTSPFNYYSDNIHISNKPILLSLGNHDVGNSSIINLCGTHEQCYNRYISPYINSWNVVDTGKNYYYKDCTDEKIRFINLYEFDEPLIVNPDDPTSYLYYRGFTFYSDAQISWFIEVLNNTPDDYGVIIAMHQPEGKIIGESNFMAKSSVTTWNIFTFVSNGEMVIADIINAFKNKSSLNKTYNTTINIPITVSADFSSKTNTEFICYLNGHKHKDLVGVYEKYQDQIVLNIDCDNTFYSTVSDINKVNGTKTEDIINIYGINRNKKTISIVRVGGDVSNDMTNRKTLLLKY